MIGVYSKVKGFTLIEMIAVMLLLAVLAAGIGSFIKLGSQIFVDSSTRAELISSGRFVVERLNREIRGALPNSMRLIGSGNCLEFTPSVISSIYIDIPVSPEPATEQVSIARFFDSSLFNNQLRVAVYPTSSDDVYNLANNKVFDIESGTGLAVDGERRIITLDDPIQFAADSPTNRLYLIDSPVSFCLESGSLLRYADYSGYNGSSYPNNVGILMAERISNLSSFTVAAATQHRNATVLVVLTFEDNNETFTFSNEVQIPNVP